MARNNDDYDDEDNRSSDITNERRSRRSREDRDDYDDPPRRKRRNRDDYDDPRESPTSVLAIVSLAVGVASCLLVVTSPISAICGIIALAQISKSNGQLKGKGFAIAGLVLSVLSLITLGAGYMIKLKIDEAGERMRAINNYKQVGIALHSFHDSNGYFPQSDEFRDLAGQPLLSWRVAILPYLGEDALYRQFRHDRPWDDPQNLALLNRMPKVYATPGLPDEAAKGLTRCQGFVGPGTIFESIKGNDRNNRVRITTIVDGTSNTIMVAEAGDPVEWTKPADMKFNPSGELPRLGAKPGRVIILMGDGFARSASDKTSPQTLKAAITRNGGEIVPMDW